MTATPLLPKLSNPYGSWATGSGVACSEWETYTFQSKPETALGHAAVPARCSEIVRSDRPVRRRASGDGAGARSHAQLQLHHHGADTDGDAAVCSAADADEPDDADGGAHPVAATEPVQSALDAADPRTQNCHRHSARSPGCHSGSEAERIAFSCLAGLLAHSVHSTQPQSVSAGKDKGSGQGKGHRADEAGQRQEQVPGHGGQGQVKHSATGSSLHVKHPRRALKYRMRDNDNDNDLRVCALRYLFEQFHCNLRSFETGGRYRTECKDQTAMKWLFMKWFIVVS